MIQCPSECALLPGSMFQLMIITGVKRCVGRVPLAICPAVGLSQGGHTKAAMAVTAQSFASV